MRYSDGADATRRSAVLAFALALTGPWLVPAGPASLSLTTPAQAQTPAQPAKLTKPQTDAVAAYDKALASFKAILAQRRAEIDARKKLPERPGQAIYLARVKVISTYKDLTDALPSRIGKPNRFGVPPAYFEAGIEPLIEEYAALFSHLQAPPAFAQASATPFEDVADLGRAIALARGADAETADAAARISLGLFLAETNGNQNIGNARSNTYKGSMQTGVAEDRSGRAKWMALRPKIAALAPLIAQRDAKEEARAKGIDQRYNHWTAVRNGLMNAHAGLFAELPEIRKMLPDEIDQMKVFQLIQLIPAPTREALRSGNFEAYRITSPRIMGYLRNNSIFAFGKADRARTSATFREVLDAMWLFTPKFERARAKFGEIKAQAKGVAR